MAQSKANPYAGGLVTTGSERPRLSRTTVERCGRRLTTSVSNKNTKRRSDLKLMMRRRKQVVILCLMRNQAKGPEGLQDVRRHDAAASWTRGVGSGSPRVVLSNIFASINRPQISVIQARRSPLCWMQLLHTCDHDSIVWGLCEVSILLTTRGCRGQDRGSEGVAVSEYPLCIALVSGSCRMVHIRLTIQTHQPMNPP